MGSWSHGSGDAHSSAAQCRVSAGKVKHINPRLEALIQEETSLSLLYCNPALERRIRGGLSYSEPRSLYSQVTDFTQRFSIIWKILVDFSRPSDFPCLPWACRCRHDLSTGGFRDTASGGDLYTFSSLGVMEKLGMTIGSLASLLATQDRHCLQREAIIPL